MIRRVLIAFASTVVLILLVVWGLAASNRTFFGGDSNADLTKIATSGLPIVQAVYSYRAVNGLWPQQLKDLVPAFLQAAPGPQWEYSWTNFGGNRIRTDLPSRSLAIEFCFSDQNNAGWTAGNRDSQISLNIPAPKNSPPLPTDPKIAAARVAELRRRAALEPAELIHRQGLVTDLARLQSWQEALAVCNQARIDFPNDWWPQFATASMLVETTDLKSADAQLVQWAGIQPNFVRYWVLAQFREKHQMHGEAMAALGKAVGFPIKSDDGISYTTAAMGFMAARSAYEQGRHDLVLSICDRWKSISIYEREPSYRAFQSASLLATGNFGAAKAAIEELVPIANTQAVWATGLSGLKQAVDMKNQGYVYTIGGMWPALDYSIEYK